MEIIKCNNPDCNDEAIYFCSCEIPTQFLCKKHISLHISLSISKSNANSTLTNILSYNNTDQSNQNLQDSSLISCSKMFYIDNKSGGVSIYIDEFKVEKWNPYKFKKDYTTKICQNLPKDLKLIISSSNGFKAHETCLFLIDSNNAIILMRKIPYVISDKSSLVYNNGSIYIFGRIKGKGQDFAESMKYDIIKDTYLKISSCNLQIINCTAIWFEDRILIAGRNYTGVLAYDPNINCNTHVKDLTMGTSKLIFPGNNSLFIIESAKDIYESDGSNIYSWNAIKASYFPSFNDVSHIVPYKDNLYFVLHSKLLYSFNLNEKEIKFHMRVIDPNYKVLKR